MRLLLPGRLGIQGVLGVLAGTLLMTAPARPATAADETIFRSPDLRIFRALDKNGTPTLVLTNLDDEGNRLGGGWPEPACPDLQGRVGPAEPTAASQAPSGRQESGGQGLSRRGGEVNVVVNQGDGVERPVDGGDVEVRNGEGGGTTVIVNINNAPPAPEPAASPMLIYPAIGYGGIVGPFRYPENHHFLGYTTSVRGPSFFGGLGLNAGNNFGLKTGRACGQGFDCIFNP